MKPAPSPENESRRIASLRGLELLDSHAEERFDRLTRLAQRLFGTQIALFSLVDAHRQWFKSRQGLDAEETPRDISFCGHAILGEEPLIVSDTHEDIRFVDNPLVIGGPMIRFYAGYPVSAPDGLKIGTLCIIDSQPRPFDPEDVQMLVDLGRTVEDEIGAQVRATTDELTNLINRRGFDNLAAKSLALCRRSGLPATLVFFDLDGFKAINDNLGHAAGDAALREFAELLWVCFRESDIAARMGGDEFCVLLVGSDAAKCAAPIQRLRESLALRNAQPDAEFALRCSIGEVEFEPVRHASLQDLLQEADERMYQEKRADGEAPPVENDGGGPGTSA